MMQSRMRASYVEESGGAEAFREVEIEVSPELVLDIMLEPGTATFGKKPSQLELNEDAHALITLIQQGESRSLIQTLDEEELAAVVEVILEAEAAGLLPVKRPAIGPGLLPGRAVRSSAAGRRSTFTP